LLRISDKGSVADPGCLYRIPDPDFYPSRIPDPDFLSIPHPGSKNSNKTREEKEISLQARNFRKFKIFHFEQSSYKKKFEQVHKELKYRTFYPYNCQPSSQKYGLGIRDPKPGSGKNLSGIPGRKKSTDPETGSATLDQGEQRI
jgi:hypothetical protein